MDSSAAENRASSTWRSIRSAPTGAWKPTQFGGVRQDIQWRIGSYRNIYSQVSGPGNVTAFSPKTATQWANYVNNGWRVYQFNNRQFTQYFGPQFNQTTPSPTTVTRVLRQKFGPGIKAVTRGRNSSWLIATTPSVNRGPFKNYNWK